MDGRAGDGFDGFVGTDDLDADDRVDFPGDEARDGDAGPVGWVLNPPFITTSRAESPTYVGAILGHSSTAVTKAEPWTCSSSMFISKCLPAKMLC
ncbi:hypothetical protein SH449x_003462 [Pirellulaceae bacterium SH449]